MSIRYDDALASVVQAVVDAGGLPLIDSRDLGFLRDAAGVITVIRITVRHDTDYGPIQAALLRVPAYVDPTYVLATPSDLLDEELANPDSYHEVIVELNDGRSVTVLILHRRMFGADWLSAVRDAVSNETPIVAFCSLKGGVGRSTALSVAARDLSNAGLRVLAIDLDLEAPGLGSMLLPKDNRPKFGTLDYYVERGPSAFTEIDFSSMMEASPYFEGGAPVYVAPAFGANTFAYPENVLGKLSLAYIDDVSPTGETITFLDRTRLLIAGLLQARTFDVVLVDSRAGLHETAAASMLGIGADVLLFGTFQPQTFEGYLPLLAHIQKVVPESSKLLPRLRMVHAKADLLNQSEMESFRDESHKMFSATIYGEPEQSVYEFEQGASTWYNVSDYDGPHYPWIIAESAKFRLFDPASHTSQLDVSVIGEVFGDFLPSLRQNITARLEAPSGAE